MEQIDEFMDRLIEERGSTGLSKDDKKELKKTLTQELLDQIDKAAIYALPEDKAIELAKKTDDPNFTNDDVAKFIQDSGVDLQQVALHTMVEFRNFYLAEGNKDEQGNGAEQQ